MKLRDEEKAKRKKDRRRPSESRFGGVELARHKTDNKQDAPSFPNFSEPRANFGVAENYTVLKPSTSNGSVNSSSQYSAKSLATSKDTISQQTAKSRRMHSRSSERSTPRMEAPPPAASESPLTRTNRRFNTDVMGYQPNAAPDPRGSILRRVGFEQNDVVIGPEPELDSRPGGRRSFRVHRGNTDVMGYQPNAAPDPRGSISRRVGFEQNDVVIEPEPELESRPGGRRSFRVHRGNVASIGQRLQEEEEALRKWTPKDEGFSPQLPQADRALATRRKAPSGSATIYPPAAAPPVETEATLPQDFIPLSTNEPAASRDLPVLPPPNVPVEKTPAASRDSPVLPPPNIPVEKTPAASRDSPVLPPPNVPVEKTPKQTVSNSKQFWEKLDQGKAAVKPQPLPIFGGGVRAKIAALQSGRSVSAGSIAAADSRSMSTRGNNLAVGVFTEVEDSRFRAQLRPIPEVSSTGSSEGKAVEPTPSASIESSMSPAVRTPSTIPVMDGFLLDTAQNVDAIERPLTSTSEVLPSGGKVTTAEEEPAKKAATERNLFDERLKIVEQIKAHHAQEGKAKMDTANKSVESSDTSVVTKAVDGLSTLTLGGLPLGVVSIQHSDESLTADECLTSPPMKANGEEVTQPVGPPAPVGVTHHGEGSVATAKSVTFSEEVVYIAQRDGPPVPAIVITYDDGSVATAESATLNEEELYTKPQQVNNGATSQSQDGEDEAEWTPPSPGHHWRVRARYMAQFAVPSGPWYYPLNAPWLWPDHAPWTWEFPPSEPQRSYGYQGPPTTIGDFITVHPVPDFIFMPDYEFTHPRPPAISSSLPDYKSPEERARFEDLMMGEPGPSIQEVLRDPEQDSSQVAEEAWPMTRGRSITK